jgi:hypothetical protein
MPIDAAMAKAFGLEGDAWMRHANPWSVYTRIPIPPLLAGAIWSRSRLGRRSLIPIALVCAWAVINPRAFLPPRSLDHWASRGVLGETYWAKRKEIPIPPRHRVAPNVLGAISALGVPFVARPRRAGRVDGHVRTGGPVGREGLVHRPDGPPVRRRRPVGGRRPRPGTDPVGRVAAVIGAGSVVR